MILVSIGVDPGYRACGLGVIRRGRDQRWYAHHVQTIRTNPSATFHQRLHAIYAGLKRIPRSVFEGIKVEEVVFACEDQTGAHEGKRREGKTSSDALLVQQVVGLARAVAIDEGFRFVEPTPAQVKAVLPGITQRADKAQVKRAVRAVVQGCPKIMSEHASDSLGTALAGARMVL